MRIRPIVALLGSLGLAGCGGGGGSSDVTLAIESTAALDGFVQFSGPVDTASTLFGAGDNLANDTARFFVSFPLGAIPAGATILSATLEVHQSFVTGTPYTDLGALVVDHLDYGGVLDAADFGLASISSAFGVLSSTPVIELKTLDVKARVEADIAAARVRSQFRGRYGAMTDALGDDDFVNCASADSISNRPILRVTYSPP